MKLPSAPQVPRSFCSSSIWRASSHSVPWKTASLEVEKWHLLRMRNREVEKVLSFNTSIQYLFSRLFVSLPNARVAISDADGDHQNRRKISANACIFVIQLISNIFCKLKHLDRKTQTGQIWFFPGRALRSFDFFFRTVIKASTILKSKWISIEMRLKYWSLLVKNYTLTSAFKRFLVEKDVHIVTLSLRLHAHLE